MTEEFDHHWENSIVKKTFVYNNRPCVVVRHKHIGHYCGYTKTTLPSMSHDDISYFEGGKYVKLIEVHGGITYGKTENGWVGFDCAHAGDVCWEDDELVSEEIADKYRDEYTRDWHIEDVSIELKHFADQLAALEQYIGNNFPTFNTY